MSFAAVPGAVKFCRIFDLGPKRPSRPDDPAFAAERKFVSAVADALAARNAFVTLALEGQESLPVVPDVLRHVDPSRLRLSVFDTLDWRLKALHDYHGASIWIGEADFQAISRALKANTGGAPEHPAKRWYAERDFNRQGLTIKALQREMESAVGRAPSASAIRAWEKEAERD